MYTIDDLFDKRSIVGSKLEQLLLERKCTKADLCEKSGVSRPTLDKVLAGTLTNKTNYMKHISKILVYLGVTPDILLGNIEIAHNMARELRNIFRISLEQIAEITGISEARLSEIEAGEPATKAELRDIAMCLSVSVSCLQGNNFFEPQIAEPSVILEQKVGSEITGCGFWGHIGVKLVGKEEYLWYPITQNTRGLVYRLIEAERIVVPCINNKVLLLNMENVEEIIFSDFDCDQPDFVNWSQDVDCGYIPLAMYEALGECAYEDLEECEEISPKMRQILQNFMEEKNWTEDDSYSLKLSRVFYASGQERPININFDADEDITGEIEIRYLYEDVGSLSNMLMCEEDSGNEILINMRNVAMLELPFLEVENAIIKHIEQE